MTTALTVVRAPETSLALAQSAWDQFFADTLAKIKNPNPDLCRELALDRTIRALGCRPRGPLSPAEREELHTRAEVKGLIATASRPRWMPRREYFADLDDDRADESLEFEESCDQALEYCEVA